MATGILIPGARRRVASTIGNQKFLGLETGSTIEHGTLLSVKDGDPKGSQTDGSVYALARVQVRPGTVIRVVGYGEEQVKQLKDMKEGADFTAFLYNMARGGYKLGEFLDPNASGPGPNPVPAAVTGVRATQPAA